jgi:hypothetical protein
MGDWEQQVLQIRGHVGPDLADEACRGAGAFYDAERAAREASGNLPGSYMRIEGFDTPEWRQYSESSAVLSWKPEDDVAAA